MRHPDELEAERAELDGLVGRIGLAQLGGAQQSVLVELRLHETEREPRRPHLGHVELPQQVGQAADVILVAVGEHDGADLAGALAQVAEVGQDEVDAEVLVTGECQAGVDDDPLVAELEHGHVLPHLADAAEGDDPAGSLHAWSVRAAPSRAIRGRVRRVLPLQWPKGGGA